MNYLAHLYLAHPTAASRAGNFLGDFITGTPASLQDSLPDDLLDGIIMHRQVDAFTDSHPSFKAAKKLLSIERRRFSGIVIDMYIDHFLAKNWTDYSDIPLAKFNDLIHTQMIDYWDYFPQNARDEVTWMVRGKWFERYQSIDGIEKSLTGIGNSREKFSPMIGSSEHLKENYDLLNTLCTEILADTEASLRS